MIPKSSGVENTILVNKVTKGKSHIQGQHVFSKSLLASRQECPFIWKIPWSQRVIALQNLENVCHIENMLCPWAPIPWFWGPVSLWPWPARLTPLFPLAPLSLSLNINSSRKPVETPAAVPAWIKCPLAFLATSTSLYHHHSCWAPIGCDHIGHCG